VVGKSIYNSTISDEMLVFTHPISGGYNHSLATFRVVLDDPQYPAHVSRLLKVNQDATDDLLITGYDPYPPTHSATLRIYYGPQTGTISESAQPWDLEITGPANTHSFGYQTHLVDLNGDATQDLVVSAYTVDTVVDEAGAVYVFFGPITTDRTAADADITLLGTEPGGWLGMDMDAPGDITGDGLPDLLVGEHNADHAAGRAWILPAPLATGTYDISDVGWSIRPDRVFESLGAKVEGVGDVDGDGSPDIIISAGGWDPNLPGDSGWIPPDTADFSVAACLGTGWVPGPCWTGDSDHTGVCGDTTFPIQSCPDWPGFHSDVYGRAYLIRGPISGPLKMPRDADLIIEGAEPLSRTFAFQSVDGKLGDVNQDGVDDFKVNSDGETWIFHGCQRP